MLESYDSTHEFLSIATCLIVAKQASRVEYIILATIRQVAMKEFKEQTDNLKQ